MSVDEDRGRRRFVGIRKAMSGAPRKGLMGGTFNPPHVAHLIVAQEVRERLTLDEVVLVPTYDHPFKGAAAAEPRHRAAMVELAVAGDPGLSADRIEVERGGTSYTVETLRALRERQPGTEWSLIIGRDNLEELPQWRESEALPDLASVIVTTRGRDGPATPLPFSGRCSFVSVPAIEISSTKIRARIEAGKSIRHWVSPAVEAYIRENALYQAARPAGSIEKAPSTG